MRNLKITLIHDPDQGTHLYKHLPSGLEFAVSSHYSGEFLEDFLTDCTPFPDRKDCDELHRPNHLNVLKDFKVKARRNQDEFVFHPTCPAQMAQLIEFIKTGACLESPKLIVTPGFFNHVYGIKD